MTADRILDFPCIRCCGTGRIEDCSDGPNFPCFEPCGECGGSGHQPRPIGPSLRFGPAAHRIEDPRNHVPGDVYAETLARAESAERRARHFRTALNDIACLGDDAAKMHARRVAREALKVEP